MRVIGYPNLTTNKDRVGISCGEHTDYGCLTFLNQDNTKGALQVQTKDGDWINADPIEGSFVVNIGDMLNVWTNDVYKSTLHRVIHKGDSYRIS
jgi:isopenicillin N synthase-like dioxygenase